MSTLQEIEQAILQLPAADFSRLCTWLHEQEAQVWDDKITIDAAAGRLDAHANKARTEFREGRCRDL